MYFTISYLQRTAFTSAICVQTPINTVLFTLEFAFIPYSLIGNKTKLCKSEKQQSY